MTKKLKLGLEMSENREKLNTLLSLDTMDDGQRSEMEKLSKRQMECEGELRAVLLAEPEPTRTAGDSAEQRELNQLVERADLADLFTCVIEHRQIDGPVRELQQHFHLLGNQIPMAMLETRAVTPAPADVGQTQSEIVPAVFPMSCATWLGISSPTVGVGDAIFPVLVTSATAGTPAENAAQADTTGSFQAEALSPSRIQAAFFWSREDQARFSGLSESLRDNLTMALGDKLDQQILNGTNGLFNGTNLANHDVTAVTAYADYRDLLAFGRVDGKYAMTVSDLKVLMGSGTYAHAAKQFRSDNAGDRAALEDLMSVTNGVKVSAHVPAVASTKQNAVVRLGMRRDAIAPIWQGPLLIPDEVTLAAKGQVMVTAVMLHAVKVIRADGFYKQATKHS